MPAFLDAIRELARCYQAFERLSAWHVRQLGLTPAQFDILATLGNTPGMSCRELSQRTLITKGTLTGVLDRLEERGLIVRNTAPEDRRSILVSLTPSGATAFEQSFKPHLDFIAPSFDTLGEAELKATTHQLSRLRLQLERGLSQAQDTQS
ncbi:MarR family winged helix-turn-helix transcriptional regulator [Chitinibacteraceae bacterium HSL-7]